MDGHVLAALRTPRLLNTAIEVQNFLTSQNWPAAISTLTDDFQLEYSFQHTSGEYRAVGQFNLGDGQSVPNTVNALEALSFVAWAEPDFASSSFVNLVPNDPLFSQQYHHQLISTPTAWDTTTGSPNVVIAVLDTGVLTTHLGLAGRIWTNPGESPGNANVDDDQNGLIDDIQGWDFIGNDRNPSPVPKIVAGKFHPKDSSTHGTMVAGAAAATLNNAFGIAGVAGGVSILPLRVCSFTGCDDTAINRARRSRRTWSRPPGPM